MDARGTCHLNQSTGGVWTLAADLTSLIFRRGVGWRSGYLTSTPEILTISVIDLR